MTSKAPFLAAVVFIGLLFWTNQSSIFDEAQGILNLKVATMAIYGFLGIGFAAYGAYLQRTGKRTIDLPRIGHIIWSVGLVLVILAVALASINWNGPAP